MQLRLQPERCAGHALCHAIDPELFPLDDAGYSTVEPQQVTATLEGTARRAVAICPEQALALCADRGA
jgi:ferredoxin